jgi:hypothetical protein
MPERVLGCAKLQYLDVFDLPAITDFYELPPEEQE